MKEVRVLLFRALSLCYDHQEWLAAVLGVNKSTVYRWVNEEFKPRYGVIHKMQEFVENGKDKRKRLSEDDFKILCKKERKLRQYNSIKAKKKEEKQRPKLDSNITPNVRADKLF